MKGGFAILICRVQIDKGRVFVTKKSWIIFIVLVSVILGLLVFYSSSKQINTSGINHDQIITDNEQNGNIDDHTLGDINAKVRLIEYADFQCPGCAGAHPAIKEVMERYKDVVVFIPRNYPLTSIHPNAKAASSAAEAAGLQNKYWEMFDLLYDKQDEWSKASISERTDLFSNYAASIGIDTDQFIEDVGSSAVSQKIAFDRQLGEDNDISSTPTFYINGKKVDSDVVNSLIQESPKDFEALLDQALKDVGVTPPTSE